MGLGKGGGSFFLSKATGANVQLISDDMRGILSITTVIPFDRHGSFYRRSW